MKFKPDPCFVLWRVFDPIFPMFGLKSKSTVYNLAIFHFLHFPSIVQVTPTFEMMKKNFYIPLLFLDCCLVAKLCPTLLWAHELYTARLLSPWDFQARILKRVAIFFSRGSSQPRDQTWVFLIAGRLFTNRATLLSLNDKLESKSYGARPKLYC